MEEMENFFEENNRKLPAGHDRLFFNGPPRTLPSNSGLLNVMRPKSRDKGGSLPKLAFSSPIIHRRTNMMENVYQPVPHMLFNGFSMSQIEEHFRHVYGGNFDSTAKTTPSPPGSHLRAERLGKGCADGRWF
ncbi:MAG: hypothetical protein LBR80_10300 [Deltaproteobacteria bacterium]|jgi:hypothetical protein|nr:hypothetical protein [Deltaproteobacteria bacterium]